MDERREEREELAAIDREQLAALEGRETAAWLDRHYPERVAA